MTSEILIMTNDTVVMGVDSAVTINNSKTHYEANKLFKLSDIPPMGIMIYGSADFGSFALETLIKDYINQTNFEELGDILKIKESFIDYLNNIPYNLTDFEDKLYSFEKNLTDKLKCISKDKLAAFLNNYKEGEILPFLENDTSLDDEFEDIRRRLDNINVDISTFKKYFSAVLIDSGTGVVIADFNKNDLRPSYISFDLITKFNDEIIISDGNFSINCNENFIIPFAQNDVIDTFISGINDDFKDLLGYHISEYINIYLNELIEYFIEKECINIDGVYNESEYIEKLNKNIVKAITDIVKNFKKENYHDISSSFEEVSTKVLVSIVETLIHSTSLKRKLDSKLDTVGGDIDIITITKGDGLTQQKKIDLTKK